MSNTPTTPVTPAHIYPTPPPNIVRFSRLQLTSSHQSALGAFDQAPITTLAEAVGKEATILPMMDWSIEYFQNLLRDACPLGTDIPNLIKKYAGEDWINSFEKGKKYLIAHRGFQGAFPGMGVVPEQSLQGLLAPALCGVLSVEADPTFTAGSISDRGEFALHDFSADRMLPMTGAYNAFDRRTLENVKFTFKPIDANGFETGVIYQSQEGPVSMEQFLHEVFFCTNGIILYDTRDTAPGDKIAAYALEVSRYPVGSAQRGQLLKRAVIQVYPHGYQQGAKQLRADAIAKLFALIAANAIDANLDDIMDIVRAIQLSVVMPNNGMKILVDKKLQGNPEARQEAGRRFLKSFPENGWKVATYVIAVRADDDWLLPGGFELDIERFRRHFNREPSINDKIAFENDRILHNLVKEFRADHPEIPIMFVCKAMTTSIGDKLYRHMYRDQHARLLKPNEVVDDYLYFQHSLPGKAFERGADIVITDRVADELIIFAHRDAGRTPPAKATSIIYEPFSQEALLETAKLVEEEAKAQQPGNLD
jgi:hypothetical protein